MFLGGPRYVSSRMKMTPGTAILWTALVPGLAHVRLGLALRGALAFLTSVGIFALGASIVGDRIWYFQLFQPMALLAPLLDRVPLQLLPEAPNLGCCIVLSMLREAPAEGQATFDWLRMIRLPVPNEHIGLTLMGFSGIINSLWAADAHWASQERRHSGRSPTAMAFLSWMLPGAGHALCGQRNKGLLLGAAVVTMFALGLALASGDAVDRPLRSAWWIPQALFGGGTMFAALVTAPWPEGPVGDWFDHGVAMCAVAGLMNLIVMIDAYTVAEDAGKVSGAVGDEPGDTAEKGA